MRILFPAMGKRGGGIKENQGRESVRPNVTRVNVVCKQRRKERSGAKRRARTQSATKAYGKTMCGDAVLNFFGLVWLG